MFKKILMAAVASGAALNGAPAFAQTQNGTMDVVLNVQPGCALSTGGQSPVTAGVANAVLNFGTVPSGQAGVLDSQAVSSATGGAVTVTCSSSYVGSGPTLTIGSGLHVSSSQRRMVGPANTLVSYNLYQDSGRNIAFDATTPVNIVIPAAGVAVPVNIYGRVPDATQATADGTYTDTVALTLTY